MMAKWKLLVASGAGAFLGTLTFWVVIYAVVPFLPSVVLGAQRIVLLPAAPHSSALVDRFAIQVLQDHGLGITAESYLGQISSFYGVVLQVALAAFVLFGFVSYLSIRWFSVQAAEEMIQTRLESNAFQTGLNKMVIDATEESIEQLQRQVQVASQVLQRVEQIEAAIAANASAEEPMGPPEDVHQDPQQGN